MTTYSSSSEFVTLYNAVQKFMYELVSFREYGFVVDVESPIMIFYCVLISISAC